MEEMAYKTFVWPQNPSRYQETVIREPVYSMEDGEPWFEGLGDVKRVITGSGTFYGPNAYQSYKQLQLLMEGGSPGDLYHPIWGTRYCYLTGLELTQEPKENVVSYKFTFTQCDVFGDIPK